MTQISEEHENVYTSVTEMTKVLNQFDEIQIPKRKNVDFEDAINETGSGKYNVYLILICGSVLFASITESYGVGYIVPASECELNLNSYTKGILTSTNLIGTMCSCAIWGYISDFKGRRKLLLINLVLAFITGISAAFTPSFWGFCILRLLNGICISCPAAITFVYLDEFLSATTRARSMAWGTSFVALAMTYLPSLGWVLLQNPINLDFIGLHLSNWRLYMLLNSVPSVIALLAVLKLPESPKYLYHSGRTEEALEVLKKMYAANTGNPEDTFPVLSLDEKIILETSEVEKSVCRKLTQQFVPLCKPPLLVYTLVSAFMSAGSFAVSSGLYFWYPDIINQISLSGKTSVTVCEALSFSRSGEEDDGPQCTVSQSIFILNIIIGVTYIVAYVAWGAVIKLLGMRNFFMSCMGLAAVSTAAICVLSNRLLIDIVFITSLGLSGISVTLINAWVVDIFPTEICGIALCIILTIGRLGSVIASSVIGVMLEWNCVTTFLLFAVNLVVCLGISVLLPQKS